MSGRWTASLGLLLLLTLAACGSSGDAAAEGTHLDVDGVATSALVPPDPDDPTPPSTDASEASMVDISGSLDCDAVPPTGTGAFAATAPQVCDELVSRQAILAQIGASTGQACAQIYGGPQHATIKGSIDGQSVDVSIDRSNGCGIDAWQQVEWLLGSPER